MSPKNSKFRYLYRDASNYKQFGYVVFKGLFNLNDVSSIMSNLHEGEFFIPEDVGLASLQENFDNASIDDHPWHEIELGVNPVKELFALTCEFPTDVRNVHDFAEEFARAKWDEKKAIHKMGLI